jgi:ribose transport system substrate-binding protein
MFQRRATSLIVSLVCVLVLGCNTKSSQSTTPHIAFISNGVASFWTIAKAGAEKAGRDLQVKVSVHMPAEGIADQKRIVEDLLVRGVSGIAISPIDPSNQTSLINEAATHVKVITQDADAPESKRLAYVGMDNYLAGRLLGERMKQSHPQGGSFAIVIGRLEQDNARRRRQGVIDALLSRSSDPSRFDPPGTTISDGTFTIVTTLTDQFDRVKAKSNCEDVLLRYPSLTGIVALFAYNTPACLEALKQVGALKRVQIFSFDEADETLQGIRDGTVVATVVQNPFEYGYRSIALLKDIINRVPDTVPASKLLEIPARVIDPSNVEQFWADLRTKISTP